jgi:STE24 endopeptidase
MNAFTYLFLLALLLSFITQLWLTARQQQSINNQRHRTPAPFAQQITLNAHQKAADYTIAGLKLERFDLLLSTALVMAWTLGGGLEWLNQLWLAKELSPLHTGVIVILSVMLITHIIELPIAAWRTFIIEQRFDFNHTSIGLFISDQFRELVLMFVLMTPLLYSALWLTENQEHWWLTVWLVWTGFSLLMLWVYPTLIAPLFNRFSELDDVILKQRIEQLLQRTGFTSNGIFVMDSSRRSGHGNAYFTGLGQSKRIVFYDTLLKSLNHDEIEAVLAHELGHFHHGHVRQRLVTMIILSLGVLILLSWLSKQPWFYNGLGVTQMANYVALILLMFCAPVFGYFLHPLMLAITRHHEYQADSFAARHCDAQQLSNALIKLYNENATTLTPDPLYSAFHDSHPTALARIQHLSDNTTAT